jgi:hypothetical protein
LPWKVGAVEHEEIERHEVDVSSATLLQVLKGGEALFGEGDHLAVKDGTAAFEAGEFRKEDREIAVEGFAVARVEAAG